MRHDSPQPLICHFKDCGRGQDGPFPHQNHGRLLKQQRELASFSRPWNLDLFHPVLQATDPWHGSRDEAMALEEVQMPPSHFFEIMGMAKRSADLARVACSPLGLNGEA